MPVVAPEQVSNPPAAAPAAASPPSQPVPPATPTAPAVAAAAPVAAPTTATPAHAEDVDVIEKEWVDAAQDVVKKNADDPQKEEEGFEDLQVDYLKKRYGKDIKKPSE